MLTFYEYIARSRRMALPDSHTMLGMAGVPLGFPDEEETVRLLNRDKKQRPGLLPFSWSRDNGSQGCGCSSDGGSDGVLSIGTYLSNLAAYSDGVW